ncbi:WD40 repeat-like protein [Tothia fuscella]|uniref:WD40 repeat-like protein n=1 Tax=Tothia fuscella TaxID=1048955 RepID=A0A9P4NYD4_9PEZI|nr:WD40 repeat-like protein [Tothia fuscella]
MSWHTPGAMNGADHGGSVATEYTLQGVMRFLQIEWHSHERARNAWDIERAEMVKKIAVLEGSSNKEKRQVEMLEKHVKMLEQALKAERRKSRALQVGEKAAIYEESQPSEAKGKNAVKGLYKPPVKPHNSFLSVDNPTTDLDNDELHVGKSKKYLQKCIEEITYLLLPPAHPPPPQPMQSMANANNYVNQQEAPMTMEEVFMQQRQKGQQQNNSNVAQPMPSHPPPSVPSAPDMMQLSRDTHQAPQAEMMTREPAGQQHYQQNQTLLSSPFISSSQSQQSHSGFPTVTEEPLEKIVHTYDAFGHPISSRDELSILSHHGQSLSESTDGFIFDETPSLPEPPPDGPPPRRPDTDLFPSANNIPVKSPPRTSLGAHRRRSSGSTSMARRRSQENEIQNTGGRPGSKSEPHDFKVKFALRGHLDVVRSVIFTGGGSPAEPEICTAGDDGMIKRWIIPASYANFGQHGMSNDLDIQSYFTHRGHDGVVTSLAACPSATTFSTGGRTSGDGWIFSGGQDATVRVWERGRVDPKATLDGHTDAVWAVCVLPSTSGSVFGSDSNNFGGPDRVLLASGSADGTIKIWAVSAPPQLVSPSGGSRRGVGGSRRHSVTSGSNYPSSPQPSVATTTPFHYTLVHSIDRTNLPSPTCISPLSPMGENFVVSFNDSSIIIFDTRTAEEVIGMTSNETYDGTPATGINSIVATSVGLDASESGRLLTEDESPVHGATGSSERGGVEGVVISGHEDQFIRFFDANSGQCTYSMIAHASAISSLSLSKDGREAVSAGHDASIRFWDLEKRVCMQEFTSHRIMRGEGVCSVVWSTDGRLVVSAGGDGVVKVFAR